MVLEETSIVLAIYFFFFYLLLLGMVHILDFNHGFIGEVL
jgi:hypothetical protein